MSATDNLQLQLAHRYVENTSVSVFLTGNAGTGKTTFLRDIDAHCHKRHIVLAPTGVAAVNAGGVTIHSFFQLPFDPYLPDVKELLTEYQTSVGQRSLRKSKLDVIRTLELIIIDEISMVRADLLDAVDMTLQRLRHSSMPFGGVQLLMIGDVHQLPPVVKESERQYMDQVYPSPFFFHSKALQRLQYVTIELTHVYRQQDQHFVSMLEKVRDGQLDAETLSALNGRIGIPSDGSITLTTHNRQADAINAQHMQKLTGQRRLFQASVTGNYPSLAIPVDQQLELKIGERVMFLKNDSTGGHRYYNGKLGTVHGFVEHNDNLFVEVVDDNGDVIEVGHEVWESVSYSIDPDDHTIKQHVDGTFSQYPLRAAWAVTIHKAQGLTFDKVNIDAAEAFAYGQVYVALSRCRTLQGLTLLSPLSPSVLFADHDVQQFCLSQPSAQQVAQAIQLHEQQYYYSQLVDLFDMTLIGHLSDRLLSAYANVKNIHARKYESMKAVDAQIADLVAVGERFVRQLSNMLPEQHGERVHKGAEYYIGHLEEISHTLDELLDIEVDNADHAQRIKEYGHSIMQTLGVKLASLKAVLQQGFSPAVVAQARYAAMLDDAKALPSKQNGKRNGRSSEARKRDRIKTKTSRVIRKDAGDVGVSDDQLDNITDSIVNALSLWRRQKAEQLGVKTYMVLYQTTLLALAQNIPANMDQLIAVPGIGPTKARLYGDELLQVLHQFV